MGVRTKKWGPPSWLVFEGLARFYDDYMIREKDHLLRCEMTTMVRELFFLVGFVVPCVYCRISYQGFTDPEHPEPTTDIHKFLALKNGAKRLVYNLHNRVSKKLRDQEREKYAAQPTKLSEINRKWKNHQPTYEEALKQKFPSVSSFRFWNAVMVFLGYIMCDFRTDEAVFIYNFFWGLGKVLSRAHQPALRRLAAIYAQGLEETLPLWNHIMPLSKRLDIVWIIQKRVFRSQGWKFKHTRYSFEKTCQEAIVGCVPLTRHDT